MSDAELRLDLADLRRANMLRLPVFKNRRGGLAHSAPDGSGWSLAQWANAMVGEVGEAAGIIKQIDRGDFTLDEARADLGRELADILTYLDILAYRAGINLSEATIAKWNEVSVRVGCGVRLYGCAYGPAMAPAPTSAAWPSAAGSAPGVSDDEEAGGL